MRRSHRLRSALIIAGIMMLVGGGLYACTFFKAKPPAAGDQKPAAPAPVAPPVTSSVGGAQTGDDYEDPTTLPEPGPPYAKDNRDPNVIMKNFPVDSEGNIDWVKAFKDNVVHPHESLDLNKPPMPPFNFDIEIPAVGAMPNVIFPHFPHTYWLDCGNCHPSIFVMKRGANPISMVKIVNGEFCGRCHGRVAFPISNCTRCHVKPKQ
jgi:c(7)-type cytochrome triheme protein